MIPSCSLYTYHTAMFLCCLNIYTSTPKKWGILFLPSSSFCASITNIFHHTFLSNFKLGMVLCVGVLRVAYQIHVCQLSTSFLTTYFIFLHIMVQCQSFIALSSATMHHSHFKLGMVLLLGVLHVTYQFIPVIFFLFNDLVYFRT